MDEINGMWNRLGIWDVSGKAKHNVNFGMGRSLIAGGGRAAFELAYRTLRHVDVADFKRDGKKEVIVAMSNKMVVALDCRLKTLWATRLGSPPTVIKVSAKPDGKGTLIAAGCEDGSVAVLHANGALVRLGRLTEPPLILRH